MLQEQKFFGRTQGRSWGAGYHGALLPVTWVLRTQDARHTYTRIKHALRVHSLTELYCDIISWNDITELDYGFISQHYITASYCGIITESYYGIISWNYITEL